MSNDTTNKINSDHEKMSEDITPSINQKKSASKRWLILSMVNFIFAIFFASFECLISGSLHENFWMFYFFTAGIFIAMMSLSWIISAIHRIITKKPSSEKLFVLYYFIFIIWVFYETDKTFRVTSYFNIKIWDKFKEEQTIVYITLATIVTVIFFYLILLIYKSYYASPSKKNNRA